MSNNDSTDAINNMDSENDSVDESESEAGDETEDEDELEDEIENKVEGEILLEEVEGEILLEEEEEVYDVQYEGVKTRNKQEEERVDNVMAKLNEFIGKIQDNNGDTYEIDDNTLEFYYTKNKINIENETRIKEEVILNQYLQYDQPMIRKKNICIM